jgi:hypothetical protein
MKLKPISTAGALVGCLLALPLGAARAEPHATIPASEAVQHENDVVLLRQIAGRTTPTGVAAQRLIATLAAHQAFEDAFVLPPLTLLPTLAGGTVTPDMRWGVEMSDHVRAQKAELQRMHGDVTEAILDLKTAADAENDAATVAFAERLAAVDLAQIEVTEPMVLVIGDLLRSKLATQ